MYNYIRVHSNTKFLVLNDYEVLDFYDPPTGKEITNVEELRKKLEESVLPDQLDYQFYKYVTNNELTNLNGKTAAITATEESINELHKESSFKYIYDPLEDTPELYTELAKVKEYETKSLLRFVKEYGLPFETPTKDDDQQVYIDPYKLIFGFIKLPYFYYELSRYKKIFNIWRSVISENEVELNKIKNEFSSKASLLQIKKQLTNIDSFMDNQDPQNKIDATLKRNPFTSHSISEEWDKVKDKSTKNIAMAYMVHLLNQENTGKNEFEVTERINDYKEKETIIAPTIYFQDLLEVAYYQLSQAIVNNMELRECKHCGSLFEVKHGHQKFCPPKQENNHTGKYRKRSSCENAYNQKMRREQRAKDMK